MMKIKIDKFRFFIHIITLICMNANLTLALINHSILNSLVTGFLFGSLVYTKWVDERAIAVYGKKRG